MLFPYKDDRNVWSSNWTQSLVPLHNYLVTSIANSGAVPSSTSSVKSNFKLKLDNQKLFGTYYVY